MPDHSPSGPGPVARSYLEGSRGVFVPLAAIKLAGDPAAALLFGQLLWWTAQAEHPKLRSRAGHDWLVRSYGGWQDEIGLTEKQARTAIKRLAETGLVEVRRWKHDGAPTTHLRVVWEALETALTGQIHSPSGADGNAESGESLDLPERAEPPLSETEETTDLTLSSAKAADAIAVDLCVHLANRIEANGSKRPNALSPTWVTSARRMIECDKRDPEKAHRLIDWCQDDDFESTVVLSMPKFRERYDSLRLKANRQHKANRPKETVGQAKARRGLELLAEMDQRELTA